jgi:acyl-CoA reductase-like NAD-dependent aldehyde dehydrogenase
METIRRYSMVIGGDWVDADEQFEIRSPATEELVASVAKGGREHADRAIAAAKAAHADGRWRQMPPAERAAVLDAIADRLSEQVGELAALEALENGAPVRQAGAFQIGFSIAHLRYFAGQARSYPFEGPGPLMRVPTLATGLVRREPVGVCAAIVPWNFPLLLAMWKIGPALAAGNTIVVKPDEHTPLTLLEFARIAHECGLPPGVLNVVPGEGAVVGARLATHPDVRKIAFTGSTAVGREIMRMAAGNVKRLTLELGGKGPNIVLDDADLDLAADGTLFGCLMNQGQACESGTRIIVAAAVHDKFVERLIERTKTISIGDPLDPATDFGPVISAEARDRILRYIDSGRAEGATLAYGGPAVRPRFLGRADDLHRRPQRHDDRARGDLRPGPGGDPLREHRAGGRDRQRHRIRPVRRGLEHRQPAGPRRGRPARGRHGVGQRLAHGQRRLPVRRLQAKRAGP